MFPTVAEILCPACNRKFRLKLEGTSAKHCLLTCPSCAAFVNRINVEIWQDWINRQCDRKKNLPSNKQDVGKPEEAVSFTGLAGELAACLRLCPAFVHPWCRRETAGGSNRGHDLWAQWTGFNAPIEVKEQPHCDEKRGYLLIRPPTGTSTDEQMNCSWVDDCLYVLFQRFTDKLTYQFLGWTDRDGFISSKEIDPVGWRPGQRHCWGVHHSKLWSIERLMERQTR